MPRVKLKPLAEQTIVITGASSGIGLAAARAAAAGGAKVLLAARDEAALEKAVDEIRSGGGRADYIVADVGDEAQVEAIAQAAEDRFGGFDTWVNDAGTSVTGELKDLPTADHEQLFRTNYFGVVFGSLAAVKRLRSRGGALINIGSALSDAPAPLIGAYSASKHAVKGFTEALRIELMHEKAPISVTLIKPSATDTFYPEHGKTTTGTHSSLPPPIYAPEVVASAILYAAQHPRRDITVGAQATFGRVASFLTPRALDRIYAADVMWRQQIDATRPPPARNNLYDTPGEKARTSPGGHGRRFSVTTAAQLHPGLTIGLGLLTGVAVVALLNRGTLSRAATHLLSASRRRHALDPRRLTDQIDLHQSRKALDVRPLIGAAPALGSAAAAFLIAKAQDLPLPHRRRPSLKRRAIEAAAPVSAFAKRSARNVSKGLLH